MSKQTLRDIIKCDHASHGKKRKLKDGSDAFRVVLDVDADHKSFLVHVLFNHKDYGFNNIFKEPVSLLEVQSLYRQCLIDVNSSGSCMFTYRGISFSLYIHIVPSWFTNKNGTISKFNLIRSIIIAEQLEGLSQ